MMLSSWQAIVRVHPVHLMNADSAPRWPPTPRPNQLTWTVSPPKERQLPSTALHYILYIIAYNAYAINMDNLRLLSSGIRLQRDRATPTD